MDPAEASAVRLAHDDSAGLGVSRDEVALADSRYSWLLSVLTVEGVRTLLPESRDLRVEVYPLPNLRAINVMIHGLLGRGVAETTRPDPQAKGLGEQLRARIVDIPVELLEGVSS